MNLDPIINDKEFEHFCKWIARDNFGPNVFLYSKYNQNGIDIYWTNKGKYHVIQCKQRIEPKPSELIISLESDFKTAKEYFGGELTQFIFATTASLEIAESKVNRRSGVAESLLDVCTRLSRDNYIDITLWHWDYLQEKVSESPFLMRHLLNREEGADLINEDFIKRSYQKYKDIDERQNKIEYYGGNEDIQWYGIQQNLDAPREIYHSVIDCITTSFNRPEPISAVIRGEGGSGKSVFLRRLAADLKEKYTIYWIGDDIGAFLNNELLYDIERHPQSQYVIILEDWYRNIEKTGNKEFAGNLLNKLKKMPHARLVIGDRKDKRKIYDDYVGSRYIYDLLNSENQKLLKDILIKMPEWESLISDIELNDISNATLFIALFVFSYGEQYDNKDSLIDRYKRIFKSDYNKLIEKNNSFEIGLANTLYLYANLYSSKEYSMIITLQTFLDWACFYGNCAIPAIYLSDNKRLLENKILKKYLKIEKLTSKFSGIIHKIRFHHDTMAEQGWANEHELIEVEFNENSINDLIDVLKKSNLIFDLGFLYSRLLKQPGEKGKAAARTYLNMANSEKNYFAFCMCLNLLKGEEVAKQAARDFLKMENSFVNQWAFCASLDLLKGDELARQVAIFYLNTENPYKNQEVFCACLDSLKGEEVAKQAARDFLKTENPHENYPAFSACLDSLKGEEVAKQAARDFLKTEKPHVNYWAFCTSLDLLVGDEIARQAARDFLKTENPQVNYPAFSACLDLLKDEEVAKQAARDFLKTENPHVNYPAFSVCLDLLKGEEVAKQAARDFFKTENPHENYPAFCACLMNLDVEAESIALQIVKTRATQKWSFVFHSLGILGKTNKHCDLLNEIIAEIITSKNADWFRYRELLKIPLFNIPLWVKETEELIYTWRYQTGYKRNYLFSLLNHGYVEFPEKLQGMSIGIIRNWKKELTFRSKHKAYFTRCLANVGFIGNEKIKTEVVKICNEIWNYHKHSPLKLSPNLEEWLKKIATTGEFPQWTYEESAEKLDHHPNGTLTPSNTSNAPSHSGHFASPNK